MDNNNSKAQAKLARQEGGQALSAANVEAGRIRSAGTRALGSVTATQAGNGVDLNSGSALDVAHDVSQVYEHDAQMALYGGRLKMHAKETEARFALHSGRQKLAGSILGAGSSVLGSAIKNGAFQVPPKS